MDLPLHVHVHVHTCTTCRLLFSYWAPSRVIHVYYYKVAVGFNILYVLWTPFRKSVSRGRSAQTDRNIETPAQLQQFFSELPHGTASFTSWRVSYLTATCAQCLLPCVLDKMANISLTSVGCCALVASSYLEVKISQLPVLTVDPNVHTGAFPTGFSVILTILTILNNTRQ